MVDHTPPEYRHIIDQLNGLQVEAHLPGRHDQRSHGNRRLNGQHVPTRVRGYVEEDVYGGLAFDDHERVADVTWPTSVRTYRQMRTDPKLTAVLDGYKLQLRRAQWQLDPADCRPEVVALVADDLGIPVKGEDHHGAARTRGVSWGQHLRLALTMLDYGHAGFELQAKISNGQARLVGLWERPQDTVLNIHVHPQTGEFTGISQELAGHAFDKPELAASRVAWYAHEPEGVGWWGRSLLRPAFGPWLLKREMQRVLATSSRRFGMGVPTVEWAQNSTPTPQQFSEAAKVAAAARVGDQAGLAMPPGAMLKLIGMSGGTPDTLSFIKWLDQQMATSVLMGHLDLGQTQTGSRALGESFVDAWTLALEAIGEAVADAATRQIVARLVAWNFGLEEPVPQIAVSGIGSRREVTAQSMQLLLSSGALSADPKLEEWVRREYRLPGKDPNAPPPTPAGPGGGPEPAPTPDVSAAAVDTDPTPVQYEQPPLIEAHLPGRHDQKTHGRRYAPKRQLLKALSSGTATNLDKVPTKQLDTLFAQLVTENPPNETALLALNAELGRREQAHRAPDPLADVNLPDLSDDQLLDLWSAHRAHDDARTRIDAELKERRRKARSVGDEPLVDWGEDTPDSPEQRRIDELVAKGVDYRDAYADVYGADEVARQERGTSSGRSRAEIQRAYRDFVTLQMLEAEDDLNGHLLTPEGRTRGIDPLSLFSGPAARARKWASEDLRRWWAERPRVTFTEFVAQMTGGRARVEQAVFAAGPDDDSMVDDLLWALAYVTGDFGEIEAAWNPDQRRWPKGTPGGKGGQFREKLAARIEDWVAGGRSGDPLGDFSREQLRRAARRRGVALPRGASRDEIAQALMDSAAPDEARPANAQRGVGIGRDLTGPDRFDWDDLAEQLRNVRDRASGVGDPALGSIASGQGFDGKPDLGSAADVDRVVAEGGIELFRGVSEAEYAEAFRTGGYFAGLGMYGNGTYTTTSKATAVSFYDADLPPREIARMAESADNPPGVIRMALKPGARVADRDQLMREQGDVWSQMANSPEGIRPTSSRYRTLADFGRFAAAAGYDAFLARTRDSGEQFWVVLNRTAVIAERP